jgi:AhpD family alkylhydroperoxidase
MLTVGDRIPDFDLQAVVSTDPEKAFTRVTQQSDAGLAVSAINGCGMCIESHEKAVRKEGIAAEQVQAAVRIAAVVNAAAAILDAELAGVPAVALAA